MERWEVVFNEVCFFQFIFYGDFMLLGFDVKFYEFIISEKKVRGSVGVLFLAGVFLFCFFVNQVLGSY